MDSVVVTGGLKCRSGDMAEEYKQEDINVKRLCVQIRRIIEFPEDKYRIAMEKLVNDKVLSREDMLTIHKERG